MNRISVPSQSLFSLLLVLLIPGKSLLAQDDIIWLKSQVNILAGPGMSGRGYVEDGGKKAADYIDRQFSQDGLLAFGKTAADQTATDKTGSGMANGHLQPYTFPVNSFPGKISLKLNHKSLVPGKDFLVHGASRSVSISGRPVTTINLTLLQDTLAWDTIRKGFNADGAYLLNGIDKLMQLKKLSIRTLAREFNGGVFIIPMSKKLTWLVTTDTAKATIFFVEDSVMPRHIKKISATVQAEFIPAFQTQNVIGFVKGTEYPDSFIVLTAHYDHLGKMGPKALFAGANDNASGTSMLLYMAKYYSAHPQKYSIAFMAFSGEEAGLKGSAYYTSDPLFPLNKIRFVVNMDMMGDATKGITVVNAPANPTQFALMTKINNDNHFLPDLVSRGQTKNSDHYPFSEHGVDAVFLYTNGVKPYYHDIKDRPEEVNFENGEGVVRFLQSFISQLQM